MPRPDRLSAAATALTALTALTAVALLAAATWGTIPVAAAEPSPDRRLKEVEQELKKSRVEQEELKQKAQALAQELADLNKEMVGVAREAQEHEEGLSDLEAKLAELNARERADADALERRRRQTIGVLTAVERLAWRPTEALLAQPTSPADTVRSAILLRAALPRIEEEAELLRQELRSLSALREDIAAKRHQAGVMSGKLDGEQKRMKGLVKRKQQLQQAAEEKNQDAERRLGRLAAEANDLRDLMQRLEDEQKQRRLAEDKAAKDAAREAAQQAKALNARQLRQTQPHRGEAAVPAPATDAPTQAVALTTPSATPPPSVAPFSERQGNLPYPARGHLAAQFGQATDVGTTHKGVTIETRPGAQVISPYDGQVAFAGPFRGYGLLLIIDHGEGYHTLLAGMSRIDSLVGQRLMSGEPVGVMANTEGKPALYFELRRNGQPVNPLPWLTARKDKVSG